MRNQKSKMRNRKSEIKVEPQVKQFKMSEIHPAKYNPPGYGTLRRDEPGYGTLRRDERTISERDIKKTTDAFLHAESIISCGNIFLIKEK